MSEPRPEKEADVYFRFLLLVLAADGVIALEEEAYLNSAMDSAGIEADIIENIRNEINVMKKTGLNPGYEDNVLEAIGMTDNIDLILSLVKDSFHMASVDGKISPEEEALITRMFGMFSKDANTAYLKFKDWAIKNEELREQGIALFNEISS